MVAWQEFLPIVSILVPLVTLFVVRALDKGEKHKNKFEVELNEARTFVETNKTLIARLVEHIDRHDERLRLVERDLSRVIGRLNNKHD